MVDIKEVQNKTEWEEFNLGQDWPQFLQSWNTSIQEEKMDQKVYRLGIYDNNELAGICLTEIIRAKRGNYLFVPYGPMIKDWSTDKYFTTLVQYLEEIGKGEGMDFIRICPFIENTEENRRAFTAQGFKLSPLQIIAENTWILNLEKSEEELMQGMRKTMRNLIRRAERENVTIKQEDGIQNFIALHKHTVAKHHFTPYPDKMFLEQYKAFKDDDQTIVWTAFHNNKSLASAIVMYYGNTASYHHGASIVSKIPASYLMQWAAIKEAKARGCKYYNFWGIYPGNNPKLEGVSKFKTGFGGYQKDLLPGQDMPLTHKYMFNYLVERLRRKKRGFIRR